ncbi:Pnap_2097 family protein [Donghicola sp. XS_ASV15]|uniref:Pnap_2097 family protein n=1 Tax=Donghicola sp. XS_ASV15 TaxID=3241295 RepID=UPI003513B4C9
MLDAQTTGIGVLTRQRLGMQQLSPHSLSELWALGFCGDIHWQILSDALGQAGFGFRASDGRPIYAAFCATRIELVPSPGLLGAELSVRSRLASVGTARVGSRHEFRVEGQVLGSLLMLSTFVAHDDTGSNRRIVRALPSGDCVLPDADARLKVLDTRARAASRTLRGARITRGSLAVPNPTMDFNAVGLLYFPSFTRLVASSAESTAPVRMREVVYLGNIDPGERVRILRNKTESFVACDDGRIIARAIEDA